MGKSKLTFKQILERFSYGCGDFGCNIIYTAMSAFLLFYYTDYAGVSALAVGTIMMVSRIFDGISDIIMGVIVDRTKSKFGKARPWILRMCIPFAVCGVLLFSVPASWGADSKAGLHLRNIQPDINSCIYSDQCTLFIFKCPDDTGSI